MTFGERLSDRVVAAIGGWSFIILQSLFLVAWMLFNDFGWITIDPYPHVFLNLILSFEAAYATPFILMSQNRQAEIDRATITDTLQIEIREMAEMAELRLEFKTLQTVLADIRIDAEELLQIKQLRQEIRELLRRSA